MADVATADSFGRRWCFACQRKADELPASAARCCMRNSAENLHSQAPELSCPPSNTRPATARPLLFQDPGETGSSLFLRPLKSPQPLRILSAFWIL